MMMWNKTKIVVAASAVKKLDEERGRFLQRERARKEDIRQFRKRVFEAEYELRRIESRHAQAREVLAVKRKALLTRLEQLEKLSVGVEPAGRFRDVERKLDVLRRELGELRRALEQKKSEG